MTTMNGGGVCFFPFAYRPACTEEHLLNVVNRSRMDVLQRCETCSTIWKCFYIALSVLLLVNGCLAADADVHFRVHSTLHGNSRRESISQTADSKAHSHSAYSHNQDSISVDLSSSHEADEISPRDLSRSHETASDAASLSGVSYHGDDVVHQEATTPEPPCDLCESLKLSREQLDFVHIEMSKQKILDKLRLAEPPNITAELPPLPQAVLKQGGSPMGSSRRDQEEAGTEAYYAESQQVILLTHSGRFIFFL